MDPATGGDHLEKEYEALILYRKAVSQIRSPHLVPIEHINRNQDGLFYIMPLADGEPSESPPTDPAWLCGTKRKIRGWENRFQSWT